MFNYILTSHSLATEIHETGIKTKWFDVSPETLRAYDEVAWIIELVLKSVAQHLDNLIRFLLH